MFARFFRWLFGAETPEAQPAPPAVKAESFFSTEIDLDDSLTRDARLLRLEARAFPRTVGDTYVLTGDGKAATTFAQDSNNFDSSIKAAFTLGQVGIPEAQAMWYGSQGFIGYQLCALLAQNWLINKACAIPARDAIRKGYSFTVNDGSAVGPEVLAAIEKANKRYRLNRSLVEYVKMGRVFGIRVALFKVESDDPDYYVKPFNPDAITPGSYRGISQIDPYWCVPELTSATASDPSALDFYEPTYWVISGKRYHKSHLVIMRGPEVADILKPSYLYGGLSVPQMIYERVYAAERTANEAPQLALTKRAMIFYTDAAKALANQAQFEQRLNTWAQLRDNYGVKIADKEADQIDQKDTSLSDLDAVIMTQYQIVAAAANIPATKLLGTTPKGFNATGDYEAESYHEELESIQVNDMEPLVDRHLVCLIRSDICPRFGIAPFAIDCTWKPLDSMSSKEAAEVRKINAEADKIYAVDIGAVDGQEVRAKISADEQSGFNGLPTLADEDNLSEAGAADGMDGWITVHPNGGESTGQHVLLGENGEVQGGMGGKFNGKHISEVGKKKLDPGNSVIHNVSTENKPTEHKMSNSIHALDPLTVTNAQIRETPEGAKAIQEAEGVARGMTPAFNKSGGTEAQKEYAKSLFVEVAAKEWIQTATRQGKAEATKKLEARYQDALKLKHAGKFIDAVKAKAYPDDKGRRIEAIVFSRLRADNRHADFKE